MILDNYTMITTEKLWLEQNALAQLAAVGTLPGVVGLVGLPDLHAGRTPVGMALLTEGRLYPHLIGNDIGCGMTLWDTGIALRQYKGAKWQKRLEAVDDLAALGGQAYLDAPIADLGSIGGGNHFAEFQQIEKVFDEAILAKQGIAQKNVLLLVHSGARHYGQEIAADFAAPEGLVAESARAQMYLALHDDALLWASRNRQAVAENLLTALGYQKAPRLLLDLPHNFLERTAEGWLHRKGAVSARQSLVVIPGSRGALTYLVKPKGDCAKSLYSLSHGAGRKWARSMCKGRLQGRKSRQELRQTPLGNGVICQNEQQLYQEAPEAYKSIAQIIDALLAHELIEVVATLRPLLTYKG